MATPENPRRHLLLLIALLMLIVIGPLLSVTQHGTLFLNVIGAAVLLSGLYAVSERKSIFITGIILSIVSIVTTFLLSGYPGHGMVIVAHTTMILVLGFFAVAILDYVVRSGRVTSDKIFAAICAYLLIGYAWAFGYALLDEFSPGAFVSPTEVARNDYVGRVIQMRYFSYITLATVGYGDIVPRTSGARTMVILEAVLGQFYLVALIGRLVGLQIVHGNTERDSK
jgi:Ion channel